MEVKKEILGQIKVNVYVGSPPEVIITGQIPPRIMTRMPHLITMGARKARGEARREITKAAREAEKAAPVVEPKPEITQINPIPEITTPINLPPELDRPPVVDQFIPDSVGEPAEAGEAVSLEDADKEEASENQQSEEEEHATDKGTETVHRDDEEPGSKAGPSWG